MLKQAKDFTEADWTLHNQVSHIRDYVVAALGDNHPDSQRLNALMSASEATDSAIDPGEFAEVRDAFFRQDEEILRGIFNGWLPQEWWLTGAEAIDEVRRRHASAYPFMEFLAHPDGTLEAEPCFIVTQVLAPVRVLLREGTSKVNAIATLANVMRMIEARWDELLREPEGEPAAGPA